MAILTTAILTTAILTRHTKHKEELQLADVRKAISKACLVSE